MNTCPCCTHPESRPPFEDTLGIIPRAFQLCSRCGHVWSTSASLDSSYYNSLVGRNAIDHIAMQTKLDNRIDSISTLLRDGLRILEIGCAEGTLGRRIKQEFQVDYVGLEPSRDRETACCFLDRVCANRSELLASDHDIGFDLIFSFHVLEHIADVAAELAAWGSLCSPDTRLLIEVPNEGGHPLVALDRNIEHVHQFTAASIVTLLQRSGFKVQQLTTGHFESEVYADSLRILARPSWTPEQQQSALIEKISLLFPKGFAVYGIGGDFHNYVLPLLPHLPPGRLRALHDGNTERLGEFLQGFPTLPITEFAPRDIPVLIASCRFATDIRRKLRVAGMPEALIFDLSDVLGAQYAYDSNRNKKMESRR